MRRIGRTGTEQHVAIAFEHQSRSAVLALFQIGLRIQSLAHVKRGRHRICRQRFHGGCRRIRLVESMLGDHIAGRIGDGDGIFVTEVGGGRFELANQRLRRSCIHGL